MKGHEPEFALVMDDMDADTRKGVRLLTTAAVSQRDRKPLTTLEGFVADQRRSFAPAMEKLSTANRDRATVSLSLLEDVGRRADDLRTGLGCDKVTPAGSDALGPRLRDCEPVPATGNGEPDVTSQQNGTGRTGTRQGGQSATPKPSKSGATAEPGPSGQATLPGRSTAPRVTPSVTGEVVTPTPMETFGPLDTGVEPAQEDGVLGGLLGDLF